MAPQPAGHQGLRSLRNPQDVAPPTRTIVVTHADGRKFLMEGARHALKARGVTFEVCGITLRHNKLTQPPFILDADVTPSGVARIAQLQARAHSTDIKP